MHITFSQLRGILQYNFLGLSDVCHDGDGNGYGNCTGSYYSFGDGFLNGDGEGDGHGNNYHEYDLYGDGYGNGLNENIDEDGDCAPFQYEFESDYLLFEEK